MNISHEVSTARSLTPQIQAAVIPKVADALVHFQEASSQASAEDQVNLNDVALLASSATNASDIRYEKVAAVQAALASGTYKVPSSDVAQSLIDHMLGKKA